MDANKEVKNYWIKAKGWADCGVNKAHQTAILNYKQNNITNDSLPEYSTVYYANMSRTGLVSSFFLFIVAKNVKINFDKSN